jgi:hypothetical protein
VKTIPWSESGLFVFAGSTDLEVEKDLCSDSRIPTKQHGLLHYIFWTNEEIILYMEGLLPDAQIQQYLLIDRENKSDQQHFEERK